MKKKIKIICTLGPSSYKRKVLYLLKDQKIDIFRINLSHTSPKDILAKIRYLKKNRIKNICIDTEGAQIRTTKTKKNYLLKKGLKVEIFNSNRLSTNKKIYLYPKFNINKVKTGSKISIGFNNLYLQIEKNNIISNSLICRVIKDGKLESNKGVHFHSNIKLPPLTEKDVIALKIAKKMNLKYFAISFVNKDSDIELVKKIIGNKAFIISKIETKNALKNLVSISNKSNALLIDRGDLSRYVPIEQIPVAQENIINFGKKKKIPVFVATNLLETMIKESQPSRAESHDIFSTLKEGASGLVLAAETAIGINPVGSVNFLKRSIKIFLRYKMKKNLY